VLLPPASKQKNRWIIQTIHNLEKPPPGGFSV